MAHLAPQARLRHRARGHGHRTDTASFLPWTCNVTEMKLQVTAAEAHRPHGHLEAGDPRADTNFHVQMALSEFSFFQ